MTVALKRPAEFSNRDVLCGVIAASASRLKRPASLDLAGRICAPLFHDYPPDPARWRPDIDPEHALAAIAYAREALTSGAITKPEYDFVCATTRRALLRGVE